MLDHYSKKEKRLLREAEKKYYNEIFNQHANDARKVWATINRLVPQKKQKKMQPWITQEPKNVRRVQRPLSHSRSKDSGKSKSHGQETENRLRRNNRLHRIAKTGHRANLGKKGRRSNHEDSKHQICKPRFLQTPALETSTACNPSNYNKCYQRFNLNINRAQAMEVGQSHSYTKDKRK